MNNYFIQDNSFEKTETIKNQNFVEHIEAIAYVICGNNQVSSEQFYQILSAKGVAKKIVELLREGTKGG